MLFLFLCVIPCRGSCSFSCCSIKLWCRCRAPLLATSSTSYSSSLDFLFRFRFFPYNCTGTLYRCRIGVSGLIIIPPPFEAWWSFEYIPIVFGFCLIVVLVSIFSRHIRRHRERELLFLFILSCFVVEKRDDDADGFAYCSGGSRSSLGVGEMFRQALTITTDYHHSCTIWRLVSLPYTCTCTALLPCPSIEPLVSCNVIRRPSRDSQWFFRLCFDLYFIQAPLSDANSTTRVPLRCWTRRQGRTTTAPPLLLKAQLSTKPLCRATRLLRAQGTHLSRTFIVSFALRLMRSMLLVVVRGVFRNVSGGGGSGLF